MVEIQVSFPYVKDLPSGRGCKGMLASHIKWQLSPLGVHSHVLEGEWFLPSTHDRIFASAIMKVTENLIHISEIVSLNLLLCQTCVSHALSSSVFCCPRAVLSSSPGCLVALVVK